MRDVMGGYRRARAWEDADVLGHGRILMCENMGEYRCERIWENADV